MSRVPLLLLGAGGHARACIDVIEQDGKFTVAGLVGLVDEVGTRVLGYPVLGSDAELPELLRDHHNALVTVGQIKTPDLRIRLFELVERSGCSSPVVVSPRAYVSPHAAIGSGSIVMHGAVVNAGAVVGRNCIINSQSLVEHDVVVADHCHIATAVAINSGVRIGTGTFVGSNSSVRQSVTIGERCVVGMGARVLTDCEAGTRVVSARDRS
jgi:sugar O-acyltransferase (sialic acid O-acetyltransferase NeuD family)